MVFDHIFLIKCHDQTAMQAMRVLLHPMKGRMEQTTVYSICVTAFKDRP